MQRTKSTDERIVLVYALENFLGYLESQLDLLSTYIGVHTGFDVRRVIPKEANVVHPIHQFRGEDHRVPKRFQTLGQVGAVGSAILTYELKGFPDH